MLKTKTKLSSVWQIIKKGNTFMVVTLVLLLMTMLVSTNYANSQSLERNDLGQQIKMTEDDLRLHNTNVSELQTTERIEQESQRLDLVKIQAENIYYVDGDHDLVALK
ncbi:MAG: hypothetical protein HOC78_02785 [Candidatus Komeilibacteria bacterium]|jgi:hypothetical protein|nr:hypothetical protein [Candidatus Komeilibacteria bacterium]